MSRQLQVALDRGMEGRFVQMDFSDAFDRVNHRCLLNKLGFVGVGAQFLSIVSQFNDKRQRMSFDGKVSVSVNIILGGASR